MIKYKFMSSERRGPYTGMQYPLYYLPALGGEVFECWRGWHACSAEQVCRWLNWRVMEVDAAEWVEFSDKCATVGEVKIIREGTLDVVAFCWECANRARMHAENIPQGYRAEYALHRAELARMWADGVIAISNKKDRYFYAATAHSALAIAQEASSVASIGPAEFLITENLSEPERVWQSRWIMDAIVWESVNEN